MVIYVEEWSGSTIEEKKGEEPPNANQVTKGQIDGMNPQVENSTIGEIEALVSRTLI